MDVDIIATLGAVMEINTEGYKSDFKYDIEMFKQAAKEPDSENTRLLWLSRQNGTECFIERDVYLKECHANNAWCYYNSPGNSIKAYAVEITGMENGRVKGNLYELDYSAHVRDVQKAVLPVDTVKLKYKDGAELTMPYKQFDGNTQRLYYEHGSLIDRRNEPKDPAALAAILAAAHHERQDTRFYRPAVFKVQTRTQPRKPSIRERLQENKAKLAAEKAAPSRAATKSNTLEV
jgi:hypothetical protein